jgi:hypothetical protein
MLRNLGGELGILDISWEPEFGYILIYRLQDSCNREVILQLNGHSLICQCLEDREDKLFSVQIDDQLEDS